MQIGAGTYVGWSKEVVMQKPTELADKCGSVLWVDVKGVGSLPCELHLYCINNLLTYPNDINILLTIRWDGTNAMMFNCDVVKHLIKGLNYWSLYLTIWRQVKQSWLYIRWIFVNLVNFLIQPYLQNIRSITPKGVITFIYFLFF